MQLTQRDYERIMNLGIKMSTERNRNYLLDSILKNGMAITHCDAATLYLYQDDMLVFRVMRTISMGVRRGMQGEPVDDMPPVPFREENVCAYTAIHRKIVNIPDVYDNREFDFSGPKNYDRLTGYQTKSMLVVPVENNEGELIGVLQLINSLNAEGNIVAFDRQYEIIIRSLSSLAAIELTNLRYMEDIKAQLRSFVEAMATAIDERTPYNGSHTRKVAEYSLMLADKINEKHELGVCEEYFGEERREKLELAALLHDIGKMVIPRSVMNRATRLGEEIKALEDRFVLLDSLYEIDFLKGKITQEEFLEKQRELETDLELIRRVDKVEILTDEEYNQVQAIAKKVYIKEVDNKLPDTDKCALDKKNRIQKISWLTCQERECLSIRKGTLTIEARQQMENHVVMTSKILDKVYFNKNYADVPKWAGEHHEFLDGTGYPKHLKGDEISLETRILTVADIYDALTARDRPYKKAISRDEALAILEEMAQEGKVDGCLVKWLSESLEEK